MMNSKLAYQEETWEELINGQVVAMSPKPKFNHHRTAWNIANIFDYYLRGKRCTAIAIGSISFSPTRTVLCPT